jgi:hypothetical protein
MARLKEHFSFHVRELIYHLSVALNPTGNPEGEKLLAIVTGKADGKIKLALNPTSHNSEDRLVLLQVIKTAVDQAIAKQMI